MKYLAGALLMCAGAYLEVNSSSSSATLFFATGVMVMWLGKNTPLFQTTHKHIQK